MEDITVRAVLDYAIEKEIEAQTRYMRMAGMARRESTKKLFLRLANMEEGHKDKLRSMTARDIADYRLKNIPDLRLAEKIDEKEFKPDMDMLGAITLAVKAEEAALELYMEAARGIPEGEDKKVFAVLAQEEKQHKLDLEMEYRELQSDYDYNVKEEE